MVKAYDVIIVGCGAAGLSAARANLERNRTVLILDMGSAPARKVSVSGGGRCNFTNAGARFERYFGKNPEFVRSALSQVTPDDILDWARRRNIAWIEKSPGQYFAAGGSDAVVSALLKDADGAHIGLNEPAESIEKEDGKFIVNDAYISDSLIIATGGISFPTLTVSDFGYVVAKKFGHKIVPPAPGLVGLRTDLFGEELSGISLPVEISVGKRRISDSLLFTHFGIGGPAAYRASLLDLDNDVHINFLPGIDICDILVKSKRVDGKKTLITLLSAYLPSRFAKWIAGENTRNIADARDADLLVISKKINDFIIAGGVLKRRGLQSAEVVTGGVSTDFVSSKTMESKLCGGLYFAGEVLDIAGDLGGFNLHFAFASGIVAGRNS